MDRQKQTHSNPFPSLYLQGCILTLSSTPVFTFHPTPFSITSLAYFVSSSPTLLACQHVSQTVRQAGREREKERESAGDRASTVRGPRFVWPPRRRMLKDHNMAVRLTADFKENQTAPFKKVCRLRRIVNPRSSSHEPSIRHYRCRV